MSKVNRTYRIYAKPARGLIPAYVVPGIEGERLVYAEGGVPLRCATEDEALAEAGRNLCAFLNGQTRSRTKHGYTRLGGAEFAVALRDLGITPSEFGVLYGTQLDRVMKWIHGEDDIPHPVRVILALLTMPGGLALARQITGAAIVDKRDAAE